MPNFLFVLGRITLKKPCKPDLVLPSYATDENIRIEVDFTASVFVGTDTLEDFICGNSYKQENVRARFR